MTVSFIIKKERGSNTKETAYLFMKNLVAKAVSTGPGRCAHTIVIVLDNARAHLDIEIKDFSSVSEEKEIVFLKLGPNRFLLNLIEIAWS